MKIVSVNVGQPRVVEYRGKRVETGIFKTPVDQPVSLRPLGLEDDVQVDKRYHGGKDQAAYVYDVSFYNYWREREARTDLTAGQFGENLTVEGLPDEQVWIGDTYRMGETMVQVSHPRVPCFKLGVRMDDAGFVKRFHNAAKVGYYVRVVEPGKVAAGDPIALVERDPHSMTVAEVYRVLHVDTDDVEGARRGAQLTHLTLEWREKLRERT